MIKVNSRRNLSKALTCGTAMVLVSLMAAPVLAQTAAPAAPAAQTTEDTVIVVGTRASQQSAIDRKKRAKTAQDSIVADDVGSFPDRNLNEAISRIAGTAIQRNGFGEGDSVSIRGNGPDTTRVEMDGMSVNSSGFDIATGGVNGGGRSSDLRELPADLIKSVDVVKGQTADQTEGGLGASVVIKTRTGLDFKKPYFQLRIGGSRNSLSEKIAPDIGLIASRKFFNNRLGVLFNLSASKVLNDSHSLTTGGTNDRQGYSRFLDLDNSPNKTFSFNPAAAAGSTINTPILASPLATGTATFNSATPLEFLTKAAAATSKAQCLSAFPELTTTQLNTIAAGSNNATRQAAQAQRINEQIACLNQWNDYTPTLIRDRVTTQYEDRLATDIRFDYRINDYLTVFAKYAVSNREQQEITRNRTRGGISSFGGLTAGGTTGIFGQSLVTNTNIPAGSINYLTPVTANGYYLYNASQPTGSTIFDGNATTTVTNMSYPTYGTVANIVPGSVVVDSNHHATSFDVTNASVGMDVIRNEQVWKNSYLQLGGNFKKDGWNIDFMASQSDGLYTRYDKRASRSYTYGTATMKVLPSGVWTFDVPATYDEENMANYVQLNAPTAAGLASYSNNITFQYNPRRVETGETQAKFDATYNFSGGRVPLFTQAKFGGSYRSLKTDYWGAGGYTASAGVFVPSLQVRGIFRACENVATTTTANLCQYGYVPNSSTAGSTGLWGTETFTQAQLINIWNNSLEKNSPTFFNGYPDTTLGKTWTSIDVDALYSQMTGAQNVNLNCLKVCMANDGKMYAQPVNKSTEDVIAGYFMTDFEHALPFGMEFTGNAGARYVYNKVQGSGYVTLNSIRKTALFNPTNPSAAAGITTTSIVKPINIDKNYADFLPSYNAALWVLPEQLVLRYSWSKTIARPPIGRLWPAGSCTNDERNEGVFDADGSVKDMTCSTFGNPALQPYKAYKTNTSLEWYPNKDTSFSLSYYRQKVVVGGPIVKTLTNVKVFEGSSEVDPVTGTPLADLDFTYNTYVNDGPNTTYGWEFASKTAFTFLPWKLKYTGMDFNVSTPRVLNASSYYDPITNENLGIPGVYDYFANLSLWYDDGTTNMRLAYQTRGATFSCISGCGDTSVNNIPNNNPVNLVRFPYNPGEPYYSDAYKYLDAKISHKFARNIEVFLEGRNLLKAGVRSIGSDRTTFADGADNLWNLSYGGRRIMFGVTYKQ